MPQAKTRIIAIAILLGGFTGVMLLVTLPSERRYSVVSEEPFGLEKLYQDFNANIVYSLRDLNKYNSSKVLLIIARSSALLNLNAIKKLVQEGGIAIVYGSPNFTRSFLNGLGLNTSIKGYVRDIVFNIGNPSHIVTNNTICGAAVLREPYSMEFSSSDVFMTSSIFSYTDLNNNGFYDLDEPIGAVHLGLNITIENGYILVIFAEGFLENEILIYNVDFIKCVAKDRLIVIDQSEVVNDPVEVLRIVLKRSTVNIYVILVLVLVLGVVAYIVYKEI